MARPREVLSLFAERNKFSQGETETKGTHTLPGSGAAASREHRPSPLYDEARKGEETIIVGVHESR